MSSHARDTQRLHAVSTMHVCRKGTRVCAIIAAEEGAVRACAGALDKVGEGVEEVAEVLLGAVRG
eukprot:1298032-Rhodomonas_salina.4